ncbi:tRNA 2'-phosphotransferase 1 [Drosophila nasuta]|uniref:tRNA 2'-phosphotransferase 1 n=1 Tax=Drosophila nasuta TaxID=42062 RepID=UPI00295E3B86|nr:tRNA 2'-phosphotransferase 1 [Drosophila nasuta]
MAKTQSNTQLSKQLSWLLRHGAQKEGIAIQPEGFVCVTDIQRHPRYGANFSLEKLKELVAADAKQRYTLRCNPVTGAQEIRANQGHSLGAVTSEACLERIQSIEQLPPGAVVVHGTYYRHWERIKSEGLKRMQRNHVHFAVLNNSEGDKRGVISGFRGDCQLLIYLNVAKVLEHQLELFRSSNNVVLCAGIEGSILTEYFQRVVDRRTGKSLLI